MGSPTGINVRSTSLDICLCGKSIFRVEALRRFGASLPFLSLTACGETHVSAEPGQFSRWGPAPAAPPGRGTRRPDLPEARKSVRNRGGPIQLEHVGTRAPQNTLKFAPGAWTPLKSTLPDANSRLPRRVPCPKKLRVPGRLLLAFAALALMAAPAFAEESDLGKVDFPNSGSEAAQEAFQRGVAALHSFWFEEAGEAFKNAQEIDPDFTLAYWGEAISHNHPLWAEQDISAARDVLKRFGATRSERRAKTPTERERLYLDTVEILYGPGDKYERDELYHQAMRRLSEAHPEDNEAKAFYALSYLGLVRRGEPGFHRQMKAGAIAIELFQEQPNHPGAAHYVIHSFDDPEHAPLALEAANRYAEIAPEAHHAQHMPSHIFVQHGMWNRVSASNTVSYNASAKWVEAKNLSITKRDYHSLEWKAYADLQRGAYGAVLGAVAIVDDAVAETDDNRLRRISASIVARHASRPGGMTPSPSRWATWTRAATTRLQTCCSQWE